MTPEREAEIRRRWGNAGGDIGELLAALEKARREVERLTVLVDQAQAARSCDQDNHREEIEELRAEVEKLKDELEICQARRDEAVQASWEQGDEHDKTKEAIAPLYAEKKALRSRVAALEAGLRKYGIHDRECDAVREVPCTAACDCGLDALLAPGEVT